jgi:hypothetical protein
MRIDPTIEKPTRDLLGHAIRGELDQMSHLIYSIGDQRFLECTALSISVAGYIAIDVCRMQWPGEADLREIARHAAETTTDFDLSASQVYDFLSRVVLGTDKLDQFFSDLAIATTLPVLVTARVLVSFCPRDKEWWEYLEVIEEAIEAASAIDLSVLPVLMLRSRRQDAIEPSS